MNERDPLADRTAGSLKRVAAAWRRTSVIGQSSFDDVLFVHPDITQLDLDAAAWYPDTPADRHR